MAEKVKAIRLGEVTVVRMPDTSEGKVVSLVRERQGIIQQISQEGVKEAREAALNDAVFYGSIQASGLFDD